MICPSCNKFAAQSCDGDPEVDLELSDTSITGTVRVVVTSECCGDELKEANFEVDEDLTDAIEEALRTAITAAGLTPPEEFDLDADGVEITMDDPDVSNAERYQTTDRHGKPIKKARYQTHYYGYDAAATVNVVYPYQGAIINATVSHSWSDEVPASGMDELV